MSSAPESRLFSDRYELQKQIGRGGMADVFLARDRLLDRPVAVKVLFPEYAADPNFVERFRREAQSAANLTHPNIVGVYDWGQQDGTYFIVMEYVPGRSLADILRNEGRLTAQQATEVAGPVAAALMFAHQNGVVHRDIKPANILVSPQGAVKVADFGIARALNSATEQDLTQAGAVMGTATYFSPEQAQGAQLDPRSDLYSLGVVMYEMVTGRPPFTGDNPLAIAYKQVHETPVPPRQLEPSVHPDFEAIVLRLLAKRPGERYASADDLRADLRRFRDGKAVLARGVEPPGLAAETATAVQPPVTAGQPGPIGAGRPVPPQAQAAYRAGADLGATQQLPSTQAYPRQGGGPTPPRPGYRPQPYDPEAQYAPPKRRIGVFVVVLLLVFGAVVGLVLLLLQQLGRNGGDTAEQVVVPSVLNLTREAAEAQLRSRGLEPVVRNEQTTSVPVGVVWKQDPPPNGLVPTRSQVTITVNARDVVLVPDLTGKTREEAAAILGELGMNFTPQAVESPNDKNGKVVGQEPPPGEIERNVTIVVKFGVGVGQTVVPDIEGDRGPLTGTEAAKRITDSGLVARVVREDSEVVERDRAIRTDPPPGTQLDKGSEVLLVVSNGPPIIPVPNVIGLDPAEAAQQLAGQGFLVAREDRPEFAPGSPSIGKVFNVVPSGQAPKGSTIVMQVALEAPTTVPTTAATTVPVTTPPPTAAPTTAPTTPRPATTVAPTTAAPATTVPPPTP